MPEIIAVNLRLCARILCFSTAVTCAAVAAQAAEECAPASVWTVPGVGRIAAPEIFARAAQAQVVLLGESHDDADHHRWEAQTVAALSALQPKLVLGFEMFPRRVQPALDRWVAGELSETAFLKASDWSKVWGYDAAFYLPLFHFARMHQTPMVALNVERELVHSVRAGGLQSVAPERREGISEPAAASEAYRARLFQAYARHPERKESTPTRSDPAFEHFVEAQLVWDRAMAQALAAAATSHPGALVVGVMGSQHVAHREGVQHQLDSLGIKRIITLLPWDTGTDCSEFSADLASAVFGLAPEPVEPAAPPPPLLGVQIETVADGVRVVAVSPGSIAEAAGVQADDVVTAAAGTAVKAPAELRDIVLRMAPGAWLPLLARRKGQPIELTAKFPAAK